MVRFDDCLSPYLATLINLTKTDQKAAVAFLEHLNLSKISPKSSNTEQSAMVVDKIGPTKLAFDPPLPAAPVTVTVPPDPTVDTKTPTDSATSAEV